MATPLIPYSASRWFSPLRYARYLVLSKTGKTHWLMSLAQQDPFYASIVTTLKRYGYHIEHPVFAQNGMYLPETIEITDTCVISDAIQQAHARGEIQARFVFSARYGSAQIAHYWLHELMHFWQDLHGLFLTPLQQPHSLPIMMDVASHIAVTCLCEAMAETEALRASWRLKQAGHDSAWRGALSSLDWGSHARAYMRDVNIMPEPQAARRAFDRWYESRQRRYYEKRALGAYLAMLNELDLSHPQALSTRLRRVDLTMLIETIPITQRPNYLLLPEATALRDGQYHTIHDAQTAKRVQKLTQQFGICDNGDVADITIGSAPYIWYRSQNKALTDDG